MKKTLLTSIVVLMALIGYSQPNVYIHFTPKVGGATINTSDLGSTVYYDLNNIAFQVDAFNYYISKLELVHDGGQSINFNTADDVMLVKVNSNVYNLGQHNITNLEQVNFGVGVHQDFNHLDPNSYPTGHPLGNQQNPVMQWGWTAGYFHMALDAIGDNSGDDIPTELFQPHCLGDANYKNVSLNMSGYLETSQNILHIYINCNLDEWIFGTDPGTTGVQHTDGGIAITVMNNVESRNVFEASQEAGIAELDNVGKAYFYSSDNGVKINWKEMNGLAEFQVIDMNGRTIEHQENSNPTGEIQLSDINNGVYIFNCFDKNGKLIHSMNIAH